MWLYEGTLERFAGPRKRFPYRQRIAWPGDPAWREVRILGLWMVERLSINGHVLIGLRARPEAAPAEESRWITPTDADEADDESRSSSPGDG